MRTLIFWVLMRFWKHWQRTLVRECPCTVIPALADRSLKAVLADTEATDL